MTDDLAYLVTYLLEEQGRQRDGLPATEKELFALYRALVNVRPPKPAADRFLAVQDRMLRARIGRLGVTDAACIPACAGDARLAVWQGDITRLAADAIVNAANSQLLGCWIPGHHCIDNCIHTYAGVQLRLACADLMRRQGHDEGTGRAKVTPAFNLPAAHVVHTVGPIIMQGPPTAEDRKLLAGCYTSCLQAADDAGCTSIAFCCISTGVFGYPQEEAAGVAVRTVQSWLDAHPRTGVQRVVFDTFSDRDTELYRRLLG